jgi:hypothetical protein
VAAALIEQSCEKYGIEHERLMLHSGGRSSILAGPRPGYLSTSQWSPVSLGSASPTTTAFTGAVQDAEVPAFDEKIHNTSPNQPNLQP